MNIEIHINKKHNSCHEIGDIGGGMRSLPWFKVIRSYFMGSDVQDNLPMDLAAVFNENIKCSHA